MDRRITDALVPFAGPNLRRSLWQLGSSAATFAALWWAALLAVDTSYVLTLAIAVPAAVMMVRLFVIQHDCGHGSYFRSRRANDMVGSMLGVVTLTPYAWWRTLHALHHATSGNLDRRGWGDIDTLTVREYLALGPVRRAAYRLSRTPAALLVVGPAYQFFVRHRFASGLPAGSRRERWSVAGTNAALACGLWVAWETIGVQRLLLVHVPIMWMASSVGVWLFYVQHQFERTYWARGAEWRFEAAGLEGSSHLDFPRLLHWCTANIGFHHVHHLCPRIPNYRLAASLSAHPALARATRLTLADCVACLRLKLWDEDRKCMVPFDAIGRSPAAARSDSCAPGV